MKPIVFINHEGAEMSVFAGQVLAPLRRLAQRGASVTLVNFEHWRVFAERARRRRIREAIRDAGLTGLIWPRLPYPFHALSMLLLAAHLKRRRAAGEGPFLIHGRGPLGARIAQLCARWVPGAGARAVVFDCRGDGPAETSLYGRGPSWIRRQRRRAIERVERAVLADVDHVFAVTGPLEVLLRTRYGYRGPATVTPSAVDPNDIGLAGDLDAIRRARREALGVSDRLVVVYAGSTLGWEVPDAMIRLFKAIRARQPKAFLLALTHDRDALERLLLKAELKTEDHRIETVPHAEIGTFLAAADVALLLRQPNAVNEVASPTKFAEYLVAGTPVAVSQGVGETAAFVRSNSAGWIVPDLSEAALSQTAGQIIDDLRSARHRRSLVAGAARESLSLNAHVDRWIRAYEALTDGANEARP